MESLFDYHLNPEILQIPERKKESKRGYLNLSNNEMAYPAFEGMEWDIREAWQVTDMQSYPFFPSLLPDLSEFVGLPPDRLLLCAGTDDGIKNLMSAVAGASRRLILQEPNYEGYRHYARLHGVDIRMIPFSPPGSYDYDPETVAEILQTSPPSCVVITNPHPFTGLCLSWDALRLLAQCSRDLGHLLVIDEAYVPFNGFSHEGLLGEFENLILLRSFSKSFGIAGLRFGLILSSPPLIGYLRRWCTGYSISGPTLAVVKKLLGYWDHLRQVHSQIIKAREEMAALLRDRFPRWKIFDSKANFLTMETESPEQAHEIVSALKGQGVLIKGWEAIPEMASCIRFTIGDRSAMKRLLDLLEDFQGVPL